MIIAPVDQADRYLALHPLFRDAFAWMHDSANLRHPPGRYAVRDPEVFVNLDEGMTEPRDQRRFESHRRFIDIQVALAGGEIIEWAPVAALQLEQGFEPGGDIAFYQAPGTRTTGLLLTPGHFAIFFPEDGHRPCCAIDETPAPFRKLVFKVPVLNEG